MQSSSQQKIEYRTPLYQKLKSLNSKIYTYMENVKTIGLPDKNAKQVQFVVQESKSVEDEEDREDNEAEHLSLK